LRLVELNVRSLYDLRVSRLGSFLIIELEIFTLAGTSIHTAATRRLLRALGAMAVGVAALLALAPAAGASRAPTGSRTALRADQRSEIAQYHGQNTWWYHEMAAGSGRTLAWLSKPAPPGGELRDAISAQVISPISVFHSPNGSGNAQTSGSVGSTGHTSSQNVRQIRPDISSDPRPMLRLGTALGVVYLLFLAVWFWATRLRLRPPSSAPS
jgi:hypothetical protein